MALTKEMVVGLDIGPEQVAFAQVDINSKGVLSLANAGWAPLAPGHDDASVSNAIRELWRDSRLSCLTVASCLRSRALSVRHFRFPSLNDEELAAALMLDAEEMLQVEAGQIAMDWHENHVDTSSADSRGREGVLVAVPKDDLMRHQAILEAAGLLPVIVDVGCMALANVYLGLHGEDVAHRAVCLVNLNGGAADVAILYNGNAMYPRSLTSVGEGEGRDRFLADNITDLLKYYQFKLRREPVTDLVITGQAADMDALCRNVQKRVGIPAVAWNPCTEITIRNPRVKQKLARQPEQGMTLATAIGVAMRR